MLRLALALAALPHASAFALPAHTHSSSPVALAPAARSCVVRVGRALMGRAEKRMAKKRSRKGPQYQGGRPLRAPSGAKSNDVVPRSVVLGRLKEVPVFGLMSAAGGLVQQDGEVTHYLSPREAEKARAAVAGGARLVAKTLDEVFFDETARLKPADSALREASETSLRQTSQRVTLPAPSHGRLAHAAGKDDLPTSPHISPYLPLQAKTIPQERALVQRCSTPLFCIDGMQTTATESGATSLPIFFSKARSPSPQLRPSTQGRRRGPGDCSTQGPQPPAARRQLQSPRDLTPLSHTDPPVPTPQILQSPLDPTALWI